MNSGDLAIYDRIKLMWWIRVVVGRADDDDDGGGGDGSTKFKVV